MTSRWLNKTHETSKQIWEDDLSPKLLQGFAIEDVEDILAADAIIMFTEEPGPGTSRGGRHVEFGLAIAAHIRLIVVGPRENVFYYLPRVEQFDSFVHCCTELCRYTVHRLAAGRVQ